MRHRTTDASTERSSTATYGSVELLARELGISRQAAYAALRRGEIPHLRIGKRFILPRTAIENWLASALGTDHHPRVAA